ncbi:NmrA family transcriptional regulator [Nonomuraea sp. NPDC059194]|uniref:NmrA family transcriptional regulator n=1 Tax=Nonomuraea sp. NPDC059194 TaxID=3346764 RepID=UPI003679128D
MTNLVLGGTGKTGRRVVNKLESLGLPVRVGSRNGTPRFDWEDDRTWAPVLDGMSAAYIAYYPDMAAPGAAEHIGALSRLAVSMGVRRLVLLAGRGEEEGLPTEQALIDSGADWTILRSTWIAQNFSESFLLEPVLAGEVVLPTGDIGEPFVDAEDIADVAVAAMTTEGHAGQIYELTGPRLLSFGDAVAEIARATGREIRYESVTTKEFAAMLAEGEVPADYVEFLTELFTKVLDGRNAYLADGVKRALGREPRDFRLYAEEAAATGVWGGR